MNKLEALNIVIGAIGVPPVTSYTSAHPAAVEGRVHLARFNEEIQAKGWWFNRDTDLLLHPDTVYSKILIPSNTLSIDATDPNAPVVKRGSYLYNTDKNSFEFDSAVEVNMISEVPFDDVPVTIQGYIAWSAALEFGAIKEGDQNKLDRIERRVFSLKSDSMASELRHGNYNSTTRGVPLRILAGIRPAVRRF